ncbi:MAG TPA: hypothetical protein VLJ62_22860 [Burkholderiaceae bacterium]|nr:hypothetical protein [Burkholderiaceae bacterium]
MKSLKNLLLAKSIVAAAVAGSGIAAPTVSHAIAAGGPAAGVICRAGYTGNVVGAAFKCSKTSDIVVVLECLNPTFPTYVTRAVVGSGVGKDLCTRAGVIVSSTDLIAGLTLGQDYVFAEVNPLTVTTRSTNADHTEASLQGLPDSGVDTFAGVPVVQLNGGVGQKDNAKVTLTYFTSPVPAFGPIIIGNPGPVTPAVPFAPRPLP